MSFIVALFTDTSTELMSGAKSRKWVHHNSTNQPTNQTRVFDSLDIREKGFLDNFRFRLPILQNSLYIIKSIGNI